MELSLYSFIMGIFWFNIGIILLSIFRKNNSFICIYGIKILLFMAVACLLRCLLAIELPFTKVIPSIKIYPLIVDNLFKPLGLLESHLLELIIIVLVIIAILIFMHHMIKYMMFRKNILNFSLDVSDQIKEIYSDLIKEFNIKNPPVLNRNFYISTPCMTGFFKPMILLPYKEFSEIELYYILKHEIIHYINYDIWIKWFCIIFVSLFWWNPLVYIFKQDITQILEIRCDLKVCERLTEAQKLDYTNTILATITYFPKKIKCVENSYFSSNIGKKYASGNYLKQRFEIILYKITFKSKNFSLQSIFILFIMLLLSYSFIFQPRYEPPSEYKVVGEESNIVVIDSENSYIVIENQIYKLYFNDKFYRVLDESEVSSFKLKNIPISR